MEVYSAFDCLVENGIELSSPTEDMQIPCPFHPDSRPSARYYSRGVKDGRFHCFKCRFHLHSVALYAQFRNMEFMKALVELERRFRIKIPLRPEAPEIKDPVDRGSDYISPAWQDVPRVLKILEARLPNLRKKIPLEDYVKFCRVLDNVVWDLEKSGGEQNESMVIALHKVLTMMDESEVRASQTNLGDT